MVEKENQKEIIPEIVKITNKAEENPIQKESAGESLTNKPNEENNPKKLTNFLGKVYSRINEKEKEEKKNSENPIRFVSKGIEAKTKPCNSSKECECIVKFLKIIQKVSFEVLLTFLTMINELFVIRT